MGNSGHDWLRLEVLILRKACTLLRKLFRRRWKLSQNVEWVDGPDFGKLFVEGLGSQVYQSCGRLHKLTLEEGEVSNWDFTMLSRILLEVRFQVDGEKVKAELENENKRISELMQLRTQASQYPRKSLEDNEFCRYWEAIEKILVSFGVAGVDQLKLSPSISEDSLLTSSICSEDEQRPISPEHTSEAKRLKEQANSALISRGINAQRKIDHAIEALSSAIALKGLPDVELAVLYATRSDAYLKKAGSLAGNPEGKRDLVYFALKDAKASLNLRPAWGLAHYRVGMAYVELGKYKKAATFLDNAIDLEPDMDEIKKSRKICNIRLVEFERMSSSSGVGTNSSRGTTPDGFEDFDPTAKTFPAGLQPSYLPGATRLSPIVQHCMDRIFFDFDDPSNPLANIYKAHKLRDGQDVKRNYKEAAILYRKGVKCNNAEAMYNLALLKLHGHGVKHDVAGAILLLKRAAKQPYKVCKDPGSNFVSNVGVGESEFLLGLLHQLGVGFPQRDAFSAAAWYSDAVAHGSGPAAHNLAVLSWEGKGIARNEEKAIQLWKLGAARNVLHSMAALAIYCVKNWQTPQARSWLSTAYSMDPHEVCDDFPLNDEEQEEMEQCMQQLDIWRRMYTLRDINRWEMSVGLCSTRIPSASSSPSRRNNSGGGSGSSSVNLKPRLERMLRRLEFEKEKLRKVEEYLASLTPKPVIIHFPKGEHMHRSVSRNSEYSTDETKEDAMRGASPDHAKSEKGSVGSIAGGDSGIES